MAIVLLVPVALFWLVSAPLVAMWTLSGDAFSEYCNSVFGWFAKTLRVIGGHEE
jgi:hypothetical protein